MKTLQEDNMNVNIIGAGRLGSSLAKALLKLHPDTVLTLYNRSLAKGEKIIQHLGSGQSVDEFHAMPAASIVFITTPDDAIAVIAETLATQKLIPAGSMVVHCSGVLGSDVLAPLQRQGCHTASVHPLRAFAEEMQEDAFQNCHCVMEGDAAATAYLSILFKNLGALTLTIHAEKKAIYHAAAVMASNYVVTLADAAIKLLIESDVSEEHARQITHNLLQISLTNLKKSPPKEALTGPLQRGDLSTIAKHLHALQGSATEKLYRAAALATLPLTPHDAETIARLKSVLAIS
ncbi:DUF2520 domain-containing protein [Legionella sp. 27cVA30]|uniref:Rossmann-like and DUF2520 domain-containing protein n=1 Tax=Legionella TaxID=445 RepID=UPI000F8E4204|nr:MULTISPECIES: Rossmann-like and DUF2520 domain-containing protein [Legionella]MCP0914951.1 DUF2520 domain-containing protein [Legionella sp. 27cVA30]RUR16345.1 DUF2520 domain-containing protein [Legionella septentrionalis]